MLNICHLFAVISDSLYFQKKDESNVDSAFRWYVLKSGVLTALRQALNTVLTQ